MIRYILIILMLSGSAFALPENITIVNPTNDEPIFSENFDAMVFINDSVKSAQYRIVGKPWVNLEQISNTDYTSTIDISSLNNGTYTLTSKYQPEGSATWYYVTNPVSFYIEKPSPPTYSLDIHVKDNNGATIPNVNINNNSQTDGNGNYTSSGLVLGSTNNYFFNRTGYNDTIISYTVTDTYKKIEVTMNKIVTPDVKRFRVEGYEGLMFGRSVYIKVFDSSTDEGVEGANVTIYDGLGVKSLFGRTTENGRIFGGFNGEDNKEYVIEVNKIGYKDWEDSFFVTIPKAAITATPAPTVAPTASPTPNKRLFEDVGLELTDDEYRTWLTKKEAMMLAVNQSWQEQLNNNTMNATVQSTIITESKTNWVKYIIISILALGTLIYIYRSRKLLFRNLLLEQNKKVDDEKPIDSLVELPFNASSDEYVNCSLCKGKIALKSQGEEVIKKATENHNKEFHP